MYLPGLYCEPSVRLVDHLLAATIGNGRWTGLGTCRYETLFYSTVAPRTFHHERQRLTPLVLWDTKRTGNHAEATTYTPLGVIDHRPFRCFYECAHRTD